MILFRKLCEAMKPISSRFLNEALLTKGYNNHVQ